MGGGGGGGGGGEWAGKEKIIYGIQYHAKVS